MDVAATVVANARFTRKRGGRSVRERARTGAFDALDNDGRTPRAEDLSGPAGEVTTPRGPAAAGRLPLVLAGSCDAALGVLAGFDHSQCGVVWIDAHADFNTPESSVSGFFPGMSAAVIAGHCHRELWEQAGESTPVPEERIVMLGTRELSPDAERVRLERSAVGVVPWHHGQPRRDVVAALDALAALVGDVYLHADNDALDPAVAPGIVDEPVPGGLSLEQLEDAVRAVTARFRIRAVALTTFTPSRDREDRTLRAGLRVIELVAAARM